MIGVPPPQQPLTVAAPPQPAVQIGPEVGNALKAIAQTMQGMSGRPGVPGAPVDKNSPEYKQAMMQQLAATGPMGAIGATMQGLGDQYRQRQQQKQADMNAWMPTIKVGE